MDRLAELLHRPRVVGMLGPVIVGFGLVAAIALGRPFAGPTGPPVTPSAPSPGPDELVVPGGWRPVAWSSDGQRLLVRRATEFATIGTDGAVTPAPGSWATWWPGAPMTLGLVETDGGARLVLRDDAGSRTVAELAGVQSAALSADGARWAASDGMAVMAGLVEGGDQRTLLDKPATALDWNPGADLLAARVANDPDEPDAGRLYLLEADGGLHLVPLARLASGDRFAWSGDGRRLAFTGRIGDRRGLFILPADLSGPPTRLAEEVDGQSLRWSADGAWLAAARLSDEGPTTELLTVHVAASDAMVSSAGPGRVTAWSPTGERLLTVDPAGNLVLIDVADGSRTPLATGADGGCTPAWGDGPEGRIAYCDVDGGLRIRAGPPP